MFVKGESDELEVVDSTLLLPSDFSYRSMYGIELSDTARASAIKKAHDLQASIVEFHSHPLSRTAEFSPSDHSGFREFVPHVRWRLKGKPYGAVVVTSRDFDSLLWSGANSLRVLEILDGSRKLAPTGLSIQEAERRLDE